MSNYYNAQVKSSQTELVNASLSLGEKRLAHLKLAIAFKLQAEAYLEDSDSKGREASELFNTYTSIAYPETV